MSIGTVEPIGGTDTIAFIRGAIKKYQGKNVDKALVSYIKHQISIQQINVLKPLKIKNIITLCEEGESSANSSKNYIYAGLFAAIKQKLKKMI